MIPTLGRIVHYMPREHGVMRAAIISSVCKRNELKNDEMYDSEENAYDVTLHVLTPYGMEMERHVRFNADSATDLSAVGLWAWPPRV